MADEGATVLWRVGDLERRVGRVETEKADDDDVKSLAEEVKSLRRALYTFALSVVGSAVVFAFTVFELLGRGG